MTAPNLPRLALSVRQACRVTFAVVAVLVLSPPVHAVEQNCSVRCTVVTRTGATWLERCHAARNEAIMLAVKLRREKPLMNVFMARKQLRLSAASTSPAKVRATKPVSIKRVARSKGCKPGRTRDARGICGKWKHGR